MLNTMFCNFSFSHFFHSAILCQYTHRSISFICVFMLSFRENTRVQYDMTLILPQDSPCLHFQLLYFTQTKLQPKLNFSLVCYMPIILISVLFSYCSLSLYKYGKTPPLISALKGTPTSSSQANLIFEFCLCHLLAILSWQFAQHF